MRNGAALDVSFGIANKKVVTTLRHNVLARQLEPETYIQIIALIIRITLIIIITLIWRCNG